MLGKAPPNGGPKFLCALIDGALFVSTISIIKNEVVDYD